MHGSERYNRPNFGRPCIAFKKVTYVNDYSMPLYRIIAWVYVDHPYVDSCSIIPLL